MEPWDGPTMISFCNGDKIGALTDRNGLRPGRYTITKDNFIVFSSEVGVVDVPEENVAFKGQLNPGKLLLVDFLQNKVVENNDLKADIASELPYQQWLETFKIDDRFDRIDYEPSDWDEHTLFRLQKQFAYTKEDINKYMVDLVSSKRILLERWGMTHQLLFLMISQNHYLIILNNYLRKSLTLLSTLIERRL